MKAISARERDVAIDWVKACAIVVIPLIHAGPSTWSAELKTTDFALRYAWTTFAVPAFLMMSGVLYRTSTPITWPTIARRLRRLLVPYLFTCALLYGTGFVRHHGVASLAFEVLTGSTYGIYYFVPVLALCVMASWALSRMSRSSLALALVAAFGYSAAIGAHLIAPYTSPFWLFRDPLEHSGWGT